MTLRDCGCHNFFQRSTSRFLITRAAPKKSQQASGSEFGYKVALPVTTESREVMNVRQASQYLGISPDTLYRYITEGEIPAFKLGNRWKLRKTILDRWMERKMSQSHAKRR